MELDNELREQLISIIKEGKPIPMSFKNLLFPPEKKPKEYELVYGIKEREEDILADTMAVPFQPVKQFGKVKEGEWHNKLIFGDNLQALKYLIRLKEKGKLKNMDGSDGAKLIYIDPPFATKQDFKGVRGEKAYQDRIVGSEFIEFLRKRIILLKNILADEGTIYIHLDWKKAHYIKIILDELFEEHNFRNEIIWHYKSSAPPKKDFQRNHDVIFRYTKSGDYVYNVQYDPYSESTIKRFDKVDRDGRRYKIVTKRGETFRVYMKDEGTPADDVWYYQIVVGGATEDTGFPTQKPEKLLERIIKASSNMGDLVLDCFAGSGTTGAVAEKLGRRWIMVDSSKLAIYTMIKRLHSLKQEIGNKGKPLKPKPFVLYNAGLYEDHDTIIKMGEDQYKKFAMELFQVEPKEIEINGLKMNGVLFNCPVRVFSQKGYLTEEYIEDLHKTVGKSLKSRMFIIAPASRVYFLQDYIEKNGIRYYVLRIPYSVIDELHKRAFTRPMQPTSASAINQNIEAIGFDFIHPPEVKAEYYKIKPKDKLTRFMGGEELVIEIKKFEAVQRSKEPIEFKDPKDALSMVFVDRDYNGEFFNMTDYFFADEIKKQDYKIRLPSKAGKQIMIIYLDVLGNERIEVKKLSDFKRR